MYQGGKGHRRLIAIIANAVLWWASYRSPGPRIFTRVFFGGLFD